MQKEAEDGGRRLTVTLAVGQRQSLERIAKLNSMTLAHVVRLALNSFIDENHDSQIPLRFPRSTEGRA